MAKTCRAWIHNISHGSGCSRRITLFLLSTFIASLVCDPSLPFQMENSRRLAFSRMLSHFWETEEKIKTLSMPWPEKIEVLFWERKKNGCGNAFLLYLHSTYKEKWQIVKTCAHVRAQPPAHTEPFTHRSVHSRQAWVTAEEEGYWCCFGFVVPKEINTFFFLEEDPQDGRNGCTCYLNYHQNIDRMLLIMQTLWGLESQSRQLRQ